MNDIVWDHYYGHLWFPEEYICVQGQETQYWTDYKWNTGQIQHLCSTNTGNMCVVLASLVCSWFLDMYV